jgi:hypothetical protein
MKMVSLKRSKADREAEKNAGAEPSTIDDSRDGADLHLEDHHMEKMGISPTLPHGHPITLHAEGVVHRSSDGPEGGRMTIRVHKAGAEYDEPRDERESGLRGEIEKNTEESETRRDPKRFTNKSADKGKELKEPTEKTV